jgi:hypothetical protein
MESTSRCRNTISIRRIKSRKCGEAARALLEQFRSGDIVLHTSDSSALAFQYYAPDLPDHFLAGDPDYTTETTRGRTGRVAGLVPEDWNVVIAGYSRIWVVVALDHNVEYQRARVAALDEVLRHINTETIEGIYLVLFQAKSPAR